MLLPTTTQQLIFNVKFPLLRLLQFLSDLESTTPWNSPFFWDNYGNGPFCQAIVTKLYKNGLKSIKRRSPEYIFT